MIKQLKRKKWLAFGIVPLLVALVTLPLVPAPAEVSITREGSLAIEARVAIAADNPNSTMGNGEPVPLEISNPTFCRGGPPVQSVQYNFDAIEDIEDALVIINTYGLSPVHIPKGQLKNLPGEKNYPEIEARVNEYVQRNCYEIWTLLSDICNQYPEDGVCLDPPILLDNERIVKEKGKDYLVTTLAYFAVHIYSLDPLKFVTKINGLDAGPIEGEWWL